MKYEGHDTGAIVPPAKGRTDSAASANSSVSYQRRLKAEWPIISSESVLRDTPRALATSVMVIPNPVTLRVASKNFFYGVGVDISERIK